MQISLNHETASAEEFSSISRARLVARVSFLILIACGMLVIPSQVAMASCGDYLEHRFSMPNSIAKIETSNSHVPQKCVHCSSRSETPAPLPLRTSERTEKAPANICEHQAERLILSESFFDINLPADAQYFREVSTPPPKQSL